MYETINTMGVEKNCCTDMGSDWKWLTRCWFRPSYTTKPTWTLGTLQNCTICGFVPKHWQNLNVTSYFILLRLPTADSSVSLETTEDEETRMLTLHRVKPASHPWDKVKLELVVILLDSLSQGHLLDLHGTVQHKGDLQHLFHCIAIGLVETFRVQFDVSLRRLQKGETRIETDEQQPLNIVRWWAVYLDNT